MTWARNPPFLVSQEGSGCQGKAISILSTLHVCTGSHTNTNNNDWFFTLTWYFVANIKCFWLHPMGYLHVFLSREKIPCRPSWEMIWYKGQGCGSGSWPHGLTSHLLQTCPCLGGGEMSLSFLGFFEVKWTQGTHAAWSKRPADVSQNQRDAEQHYQLSLKWDFSTMSASSSFPLPQTPATVHRACLCSFPFGWWQQVNRSSLLAIAHNNMQEFAASYVNLIELCSPIH